MGEAELARAADCFTMEFHDMQESRRVLYGKDVVADLPIGQTFYRAQVEYQLRAELLRLRQHAACVMSDRQAILRLMLESVSTFCVLSRHALLLSGIECGRNKRAVATQLRSIHLGGSSFDQIIDLREKKRKAPDNDSGKLFADYLREIEAVVSYVDRLEK